MSEQSVVGRAIHKELDVVSAADVREQMALRVEHAQVMCVARARDDARCAALFGCEEHVIFAVFCGIEQTVFAIISVSLRVVRSKVRVVAIVAAVGIEKRVDNVGIGIKFGDVQWLSHPVLACIHLRVQSDRNVKRQHACEGYQDYRCTT